MHGTRQGYDEHRCRCDPCKEAKRIYRRNVDSAFRRGPLRTDDPRHGTPGGYQYWRCRCDLCREAVRVQASDRKKHLALLSPDDPRHGTVTGYSNWKCRCEPCKKARKEYGR